MAFLDEVDEVKRKSPVGKIPRPVMAGIAGVAALVLVSVGVVQASGPGLVIQQGADTATAVEESSSSSLAEKGEDVATGAAEAEAVTGAAAAGAAAAGAAGSCYVYVVGAVNHPGVYRLSDSARINDAVAAAGGFAPDAATEVVNLARVVIDGEQVTIPTRQQVEEGNFPIETTAGGTSAADASGQGGGQGTGQGASSAEGKVNINTASAAELETLNGIGEVTAGKIIASREQEGPFQSPEDLKRVAGIGEKKYAAIANDITV